MIQFELNGEYYEMIQTSKKEWVLLTVFGHTLRFDTKKLKGYSQEDVEDILKARFKRIKIYSPEAETQVL